MLNRFSTDKFLRDEGWSIESRPEKGEATWRSGRLVLTAQRALEHLLRKYGWRKGRKESWIHETGKPGTFEEALASVLKHAATKPKEMDR